MTSTYIVLVSTFISLHLLQHNVSLNILYCPKTWQKDQIQVFQLRTSSPLYEQYTDTVEHKYTKDTVFLNN